MKDTRALDCIVRVTVHGRRESKWNPNIATMIEHYESFSVTEFVYEYCKIWSRTVVINENYWNDAATSYKLAR